MVLTGCESVSTALETTNAVLGATNSVLGAATGTSSSSSRSSSSYSRTPRPTAEQQLKIDNLAFKADNAQMKQAINEAMPNIKKMLRMTSCFDVAGSKVLTTPDGTIRVAGWGLIDGYLPNHPTNKCVDVARVYGWKMPAKNVLEFIVVYYSEISGESSKSAVKMINNDGEWLVQGHFTTN